jgi:iron complex transport system substrate-binding protein
VSLNGSLSEIVSTLGLGNRLVGRDVSATFPEVADVPLVTRGHDVSAESVLSRRPTLVLAQSDTGPPDALKQIRDAGVPVVVFDQPNQIADIGAREMSVARTLGVTDEGEALRARTRAELESIQAGIPADADKPTVAFLYVRGQAGVYLIGGKGSGADSMIKAAGGIDAGTELGLKKAFTPITSEALVEAAPDVILLTTTGLESVGGIDGLVEIPGIAQTPAGKARRVVTEEDGLLFSFGSRTPVALQRLVDKLHQDSSARS